MRNPRQEDPQKPVFPLGADSSLIIARWDFHFALESSMVNLHGDNPDRFAVGGERQLLLLQRFGRLTVTSDPETAEAYFHFDMVGFNSGQLSADAKAGSALENIDRRSPLNTGITKVRKMDLRDLVGNLANLAFEKPKAKRTGFSAHNAQWTQ
jgi:hypothetical protein